MTDDHPLLVEGLKNILSKISDFEVVSTYHTVQDMNQRIGNQLIDVLLLDINVNENNTLEFIKQLRVKQPQLRVIMLSVHNEYPVINSCLMEGAAGYIQKNATVEEIITGINEVYEGRKFVCSRTQSVLDKNAKNEIKHIPKLTRREKEILAEAANGLTTQQIAEKLFISSHTVESHRKNLIQKFQSTNLSAAIKLALEYHLISPASQ